MIITCIYGLGCSPSMPSQLPVPSGFTSAVTPNCGTRAGSTPLAGAEGVDVGDGIEVVGAVGEDGDVVPDSSKIASCCAANVVEEIGQPTPGPCKFCKVTAAVFKRASCEACESSVGNETNTVGFVSTCPAATLAFNF